MKHSHMKQNLFAILAALIWGTAFVGQSKGAENLEAFTFNAARSIVGAAALFLGLTVYRKMHPTADDRTPEQRRAGRKELLKGGLCCGSALGVAACVQQLGISMTTAGKASFITALYIVLVPMCGIFMKKRVPGTVWVSVVIAVAGLYLISVKDGFSVGTGDLLILVCSFCFTAQILLVDHFAQKIDGVELSCAQLTVSALWSLLGAALFEHPTAAALQASLLPILYVGIFSSALAYTFQILAQKDSDPAMISLLLSLESVFGAMSGALFLQERMTLREYFGCALVLAAVLLSQVDLAAWQAKRKQKNEGSELT